MENNLRQHGIIDTLCKLAETAIFEGEKTIDFDLSCEHADEIIINHSTPCGEFELYCEINDEWQVYIDNTTGHSLEALHEAIRTALPRYKFDFDKAREEVRKESYNQNMTERSLVESGFFL